MYIGTNTNKVFIYVILRYQSSLYGKNNTKRPVVIREILSMKAKITYDK